MNQNQYTLYDAIQAVVSARLKLTHTCTVGIIVSYDKSQQKASVVQAFQSVRADGSVSDPVVIPNVPVFVLSGGSAAITMPIAEGDRCLLFFGEQSIDLWKQSTGSFVKPQGINTAGLSTHNMVDAIAIVGVNPFPEAVSGNGNLHITNGTAAINMGAASVAMGVGSVEMFSTISSALSTISSALNSITLPNNPSLAPYVISLNSIISSINAITGSL